MKKIPFLSVSGNHYQCGQQIGRFFKDRIHQYLDDCRGDSVSTISWKECLAATPQYLAPTEKHFPEVVAEVYGAAAGANVDPVELFATGIEEFYSKYYHIKACTDIVTLPPASNHTLVAHNNDLSPKYYDFLTQVEWNFDDGTKIYTVGLAGFLVSSGINNSKLVLSGNELSPNDIKVGIPRAYIARAILFAKDLPSAVKTALHQERASAYNNIITVPKKSVSVEASATASDLLYPENGVLVHSNHYCSTKMTSYEGKPDYTSSLQRRRSGINLTTSVSKPIDFATIKTFLTDHGENGVKDNDTICRHGQESVSVFGFAVDLDDGIVEITHGSPCENKFEKVWQV